MSFKFPVSNTTAAQHWRLWCFSPYECINPFCTDSNNSCTGIFACLRWKGCLHTKPRLKCKPVFDDGNHFSPTPGQTVRGCLANWSWCCHGLLLSTRREMLCKCDLYRPHKLTYPPCPCTIGYFQKSTFFPIHTSYRFQIFFLAVDQLRSVLDLSAVSIIAEFDLADQEQGSSTFSEELM
jgi:hypothetical protein